MKQKRKSTAVYFTWDEISTCIAAARIPYLWKVPARVRFLSMEPLLSPVQLPKDMPPDWVIVGGESGPGARHMAPDWARDLRDQCAAMGEPFFFKQMTKRAAIPPDLMVRQFPRPAASVNCEGEKL